MRLIVLYFLYRTQLLFLLRSFRVPVTLYKIDFEYLTYFLNCVDYSKYVNGSTRLKLTQTDMRSIEILLPPLQEQKRIKNSIQNIFHSLDTIMESL